MNRNDFLRMIESSGPADRAMIGEVNELVSIFPYFQSAYMLLLKGLHNTADVRFENQLRSTAMYVADREVLYYLLKKEPPGNETVKEEPLKEVVTYLESSADLQQTVIATARNSEDFIQGIEKESDGGRTGDSQGYYPEFVTTEDSDDDSTATILIIDRESGEIEEKITYMDPGFLVTESEDLLELEPDDNVPPEPDHLPGKEETEELVQKEPASSRKLQSELIEKFITANPRIEPKKEKSELPTQDISAQYVEERGEFVTETLARIYVKQGYYSRAIDIYEKLSLKFPEKSSYFASQIENVKAIIKK